MVFFLLQTNDWMKIVPELSEPQGAIYKINHAIINLDNGDYEAKARSKNKHGWSEFSEPVQFKGGTFRHFIDFHSKIF